MTRKDDFCEFQIAVDDFDLNQIPEAARSSLTPEAAIEEFLRDQLRSIALEYSVSAENGVVRATWRKSTIRPDSLDIAVDALRKGDYASGVQILELLIPSRVDDATVHYNLGMAYSDLGKLDQAIKHLSKAIDIEKDYVNAKVALGVAYSRLKLYDHAAEILKRAVLDDPDNGYALRNLGAVLMQLGRDQEDSLRYLRRAVTLLPDDQQAWFGLAQAELTAANTDGADAALLKVVEIQPFNALADSAREMRSNIAQKGFRDAVGTTPRMDAVMYIVSAMKRFSHMQLSEVEKVGFEIATIGMNGIDVNDPKSEYRLRTLSGVFSGLALVCYEYVAFKLFAPNLDIGFDLLKEYDEALRLKSIL